MMLQDKNTLLLRRHKIKLVYIFGKLMIMFSLCFLIMLSVEHFNSSPVYDNVLHFYVMPFLLLIVNLILLVHIYDIIGYYNNIILIDDNNIMIIQNSLLLREDIEVISLSQITKINIICQGILPNILGYGKLVIEQQRTQTRPLFHIHNPYLILNHINSRIDKINRNLELNPL
ncbi:MAG: hypothetical protein PHS92_02920 [Candidatus Gracilibacteria bacterium]|nr:hypothetical protein [Candidatus Gracilibacteria bacterium]